MDGMVDRFIPKIPGRPPGRRNNISNEQRRQAALTGELPHQFMLRVMRLGPGAKIGDHRLDWEDIQWAAKNAAPYYASRLASIQIKPDGKPPLVVQIDPDKLKDMSPQELSKMLAALMQASSPQTISGELAPPKDFEDIDPDLYEATLN